MQDKNIEKKDSQETATKEKTYLYSDHQGVVHTTSTKYFIKE